MQECTVGQNQVIEVLLHFHQLEEEAMIQIEHLF
jgi:hypothetical protein